MADSDSDDGLLARVRPQGIVAPAGAPIEECESSPESVSEESRCSIATESSDESEPTHSAFELARQRALHAQTKDDVRQLEVPVDYAAELCKDYRETGFCGFGDSCKFVHDRTAFTPSYKAGLSSAPERLPGSGGPLNPFTWGAKRPRLGADSSDSGLCPQCKLSLDSPLRLKSCGHVFCRKCALPMVRESPRCPVCNAPHHGALVPL